MSAMKSMKSGVGLAAALLGLVSLVPGGASADERGLVEVSPAVVGEPAVKPGKALPAMRCRHRAIMLGNGSVTPDLPGLSVAKGFVTSLAFSDAAGRPLEVLEAVTTDRVRAEHTMGVLHLLPQAPDNSNVSVVVGTDDIMAEYPPRLVVVELVVARGMVDCRVDLLLPPRETVKAAIPGSPDNRSRPGG